jgi:hypothetical protein
MVMATVVVVTCGILYCVYRGIAPSPQPPRVPDVLCQYVSRSLGMRCVAILGSDSILGPGALVPYPLGSPVDAPVPLPNAELFSSACVVPGEKIDALLGALKKPNTVALGTFTYHLEHNLKVGANLPLPEVANVDLTAGPDVSHIADITLKPTNAKLEMLDENLFADALADFGIRKECVDRLLASQYQVVSKALVAEVNYEIADHSGRSFSLGAAAKARMLTANVGGRTGAGTDFAAHTISATPVVLGVQFLSPGVLQSKPDLREPVVFRTTGQATVGVQGGGGNGQAPGATKSAAVGETAGVNVSGTESSECQRDYDVTHSGGGLSANLVESKKSRSVQLTLDLSGEIHGGHYVTAASCLFGHIVGITGHDNSIAAHYFASGTIRAAVRSNAPRNLMVTYSDLPKETSLTVLDPQGRAISLAGDVTAPQTVVGNGNMVLPLRGAGVYLVNFSATFEWSVTGSAGRQKLGNSWNITVGLQ